MSLAGVAIFAGLGGGLGAQEIRWNAVSAVQVEGRGFEHTAAPFDRLPVRAEKLVRAPVWALSHHSAGMLVRLRTNAVAIHVRYSLTSPRLAMAHMPATGVSGLDLYGLDAQRRWRWVAVVKPSSQRIETRLVGGLDGRPREYLLYLPLYNGISALAIGVAPGEEFAILAPRRRGALVFYGTSITQGACASRPGMAYPAILGRRLGRAVLNFGFSGNGRMEPAVGALLAELNAAAYVIDCLPNMDAKGVAARTEPLVRQLRAARPGVPIVLVEDRTFANAPFLAARRRHHAASRRELRGAFERLRAAGMRGIHYVAGEKLLGDDGEASTDGSHPSDLGMMRLADALEPFLRTALK